MAVTSIYLLRTCRCACLPCSRVLKASDGKTVTLASTKGKNLVLFF